mgnify:CR=1 FL=1
MDGKKIIDIKMIPEKKIIENILLLNINLNVTLNQKFFVFYLKSEFLSF